MNYYDIQGDKIIEPSWEKLHKTNVYREIKVSRIDRYSIYTSWHGFDPDGHDFPKIFNTTVYRNGIAFRIKDEELLKRHTTKYHALKYHDKLVEKVVILSVFH